MSNNSYLLIIILLLVSPFLCLITGRFMKVEFLLHDRTISLVSYASYIGSFLLSGFIVESVVGEMNLLNTIIAAVPGLLVALFFYSGVQKLQARFKNG